MKNIAIVLAFLIVESSFTTIKKSAPPVKGNLSGTISLSGAFALYPLVVKWAEEFRKINPNVKIDISAGGAGKGITDALAKVVDIGMASRDIYPEELKKGAFTIAVTKDAVLPTISATNPAINELLTKGIKKEIAANIWITGKYKTWSQAFGVKLNSPIHVFTRSDAAGAAETWAKYLNKKQEDLLGIGVFGDPGLAQAVKKDPLGIGFNNIVYIYDSKTRKQTNGVRVIPIDVNGNGKIDPDEDFYGDVNTLTTAIAAGKYPSPPARDLFFVTQGKPTNPAVVEFIKWILKDGQKYVHDAGYINLAPEKIQAELSKFK